MIWIDWIFIGIILISMLTAFFRGAVRELIALVAWLLGAYIAFLSAPKLQGLLEAYIETPEFRYAIVFMIILILFLILGAIIGHLLHHAVNAIGLTGLNKTLGIVFGLARGVLGVVIFIVVAQFTPIEQLDWWGQSWMITHLQGPADELLIIIENAGFLPEMPTLPPPEQLLKR